MCNVRNLGPLCVMYGFSAYLPCGARTTLRIRTLHRLIRSKNRTLPSSTRTSPSEPRTLHSKPRTLHIGHSPQALDSKGLAVRCEYLKLLNPLKLKKTRSTRAPRFALASVDRPFFFNAFQTQRNHRPKPSKAPLYLAALGWFIREGKPESVKHHSVAAAAGKSVFQKGRNPPPGKAKRVSRLCEGVHGVDHTPWADQSQIVLNIPPFSSSRKAV